MYEWIKILHVISAALLFGTGLGTAFYMFYVNWQEDTLLIAKATEQVVLADWFFTSTSGVLQAFTGFILIYLKQYSFSATWIWGSLLGYCVAGFCWVPVVWLQMQCRDLAFHAAKTKTPLPPTYHFYFTLWSLLGIPAFVALIIVYYLMANKPF